MDDNRFDDIIKRKVSEYEEPGFDASALAALHHQMGLISLPPWYSRYRTELLIGAGFIMSTMLILLAMYFYNSRTEEVLNKTAAHMQWQQEEIHRLQTILDHSKNLPADTLYISNPQISSIPVHRLLDRIADLELIIKSLGATSQENELPEPPVNDRVSTTLTPELTFWDDKTTATLRIKHLPAHRDPLHDVARSTSQNPGQASEFSANTLRNLEKHYSNGMGIRLGPSIELSRGIYQGGAGRFDIAGGLLGDFILSPSLSIEAGAKFIHRFYEISGDEISASNIHLPDVNADLEPVVSADVDSWILEIPVNLKYRTPLSMKTHWLAGLGYSSLTSTKQIFEYDYQLDGNQSVRINESHAYTKSKMYRGTVNISLGLSNRLKNKKIIETSLYYQQGLGITGMEKMKSNFFGIRTAYWFTLR